MAAELVARADCGLVLRSGRDWSLVLVASILGLIGEWVLNLVVLLKSVSSRCPFHHICALINLVNNLGIVV